MEKTIKVGDRVCIPNDCEQLLSVEMIEMRIFPSLFFFLYFSMITFDHIDERVSRQFSLVTNPLVSFITDSLFALLLILLFGVLLLSINYFLRTRKKGYVIVTKENLIIISGLTSKVTRLIQINSIKNIEVNQTNWFSKKSDTGSVTIETEYDSICWRGYTNSRKLKNLVEMIQKNQKLAENAKGEYCGKSEKRDV